MPINEKVTLKRRQIIGGLRGLLISLAAVTVFTASAGVTADSVITQGYDATGQNLNIGSLVSIKPGELNTVEPANLSNAKSLIGVIIANNNAQVSLSSGSNQVEVATSGVNSVLVTDLNGKITAGDEITPSPIAGVGMLASDNSEVIGVAQAAFPNVSAKKVSIKTSSGNQSADIGSIPVLVSVSYYTKQPDKTLIPSALQNLANAVAGKQVKTLPIIISAVIFIITLIAVVSIVYSMVHGSIISVGRNPMAQSAVYRNVLQMSALVVGIIIVALFAIFMILTRVS
jgi:hypothetical protein